MLYILCILICCAYWTYCKYSIFCAMWYIYTVYTVHTAYAIYMYIPYILCILYILHMLWIKSTGPGSTCLGWHHVTPKCLWSLWVTWWVCASISSSIKWATTLLAYRVTWRIRNNVYKATSLFYYTGLCFVFSNRVSNILGWPGTHYVSEAGFELNPDPLECWGYIHVLGLHTTRPVLLWSQVQTHMPFQTVASWNLSPLPPSLLFAL